MSKPLILEGWLDPWPNPYRTAVELSGDGGFGMDFDHLMNLWPCVPISVFILCFGLFMKKSVLTSLAVSLGIPRKNAKKQRKFANQAWLFLYYTISTVFGLYAQGGRPFFRFPPDHASMAAFYQNAPEPDTATTLYFSFGFGFYLSELVSLCFETRRSDFGVYVMHHIATLLLLIIGFAGHDHQQGGWTLFLHDASDIFLSLAKACHYVNFEGLVNVCFAFFVAGFAFFRLYCLPLGAIASFYVAPLVKKATISYSILTFLLYGILQVLHVYWFGLILRMIYRLATGVKGDTRSDSDKDDAPKRK